MLKAGEGRFQGGGYVGSCERKGISRNSPCSQDTAQQAVAEYGEDN
jgi:hypothetical protein